MKNSLWIFALLFGLTAFAPLPANAAISRSGRPSIATKEQSAGLRRHSNTQHARRHKFSDLKTRFRLKAKKWRAAFQWAFPSGKLLSSLIFLVLSIIFFAIGGLTVIGGVFSVLGSASVILALILFVLWISERAKTVPQPTN